MNEANDVRISVAQPALSTVKVQSDDTASGYMIINASDFDASMHTLFSESHVEGGTETADTLESGSTPAATVSPAPGADSESQATPGSRSRRGAR